MVETWTSGLTNGGIPRYELKRQLVKTVCGKVLAINEFVQLSVNYLDSIVFLSPKEMLAWKESIKHPILPPALEDAVRISCFEDPVRI